VDRSARAFDRGVVRVEHSDDVGSGEDRSEFKRELLRVAASGKLARHLGVLRSLVEKVSPLTLVPPEHQLQVAVRLARLLARIVEAARDE
jgi:hypothetical protein